MEERSKISVIIPVYDEKDIIGETVEKVVAFFKKYRKLFAYELILVDDGSKDGTHKLIKSLEIKHENMRAISYNHNKGKGYAVREGLLSAKYNTTLILDADLSVRPDELLFFENIIPKYKNKSYIVAGQRQQRLKQPFYRIVAGKIFGLMVKILFNLEVFDSQCPYKMLVNIDREFIKDLKINGFAYDVELLYKAKKKGIKIHDFIVDYYNREQSHVTLRKTIRMGFDLFRIRLIL